MAELHRFRLCCKLDPSGLSERCNAISAGTQNQDVVSLQANLFRSFQHIAQLVFAPNDLAVAQDHLDTLHAA